MIQAVSETCHTKLKFNLKGESNHCEMEALSGIKKHDQALTLNSFIINFVLFFKRNHFCFKDFCPPLSTKSNNLKYKSEKIFKNAYPNQIQTTQKEKMEESRQAHEKIRQRIFVSFRDYQKKSRMNFIARVLPSTKQEIAFLKF